MSPKSETATNTSPKPWAAGNFHRGAAPKYSAEMRRQLDSAVQDAEKAGKKKADVYRRLATTWTKRHGQEYTLKQVAAQYHLRNPGLASAKAVDNAGKTVAAKSPAKPRKAASKKSATKRQAPTKRKVAAKAATPATAPSFLRPLQELAELVDGLASQLEASRRAEKLQSDRADKAEAAILRIQKLLK